MRYFEKGTRLRRVEDLMMEIPNHGKRTSGRRKSGDNHITNSVSCKDCIYLVKKQCTINECEFLVGRIQGLNISFKDLINTVIKKTMGGEIQGSKNTNKFLNAEHNERFNRVYSSHLFFSASNKEKAALYILTAYDNVWLYSFGKVDLAQIHFNRIETHNLNKSEMLIFRLAKIFYLGGKVKEFLECLPKNETDLHLVFVATLIKDYGDDVLKLREK